MKEGFAGLIVRQANFTDKFQTEITSTRIYRFYKKNASSTVKINCRTRQNIWEVLGWIFLQPPRKEFSEIKTLAKGNAETEILDLLDLID